MTEPTEPTPTAYELAQSVPSDFTWSAAGPILMQIIDLKAQEIIPVLGSLPTEFKRQVVRTFVTNALTNFDDEFGWDHPSMSEDTEDFFYAWMTEKRVEQLIPEEE